MILHVFFPHLKLINFISGLFQQQKTREAEMVKQDISGIWSRQIKNGWVYDSQDVLQNIGGKNGMCFGSGGMCQPSRGWPIQQHGQHRNQQQLYGELGLNRRVYSGCGYGYGSGYGSGGGGGGCGGLKRERAGTGVFLPRRYENNNNHKLSDSRKKPGNLQLCTIVFLQLFCVSGWIYLIISSFFGFYLSALNADEYKFC